jgi:hypothetical protein
MNVFISWSGQKSLALAEALREWLPLVLHYVKPWLSETDVPAGSRWPSELAQQLEKSTFGIVCLTRENLREPWMLFEVGAISKIVGGSAVCPYLLDIQFQDLYGPLAQFQAKKTDKKSTLELVRAINQLAELRVSSDALEELFIALWPKLSRLIKNIPPHSTPSFPRKMGEVLEDLVFSVRRLDYKMELLASRLSAPGARDQSISETAEPLDDLIYRTVIVPLAPATGTDVRGTHEYAKEQARFLVSYIGEQFEEEVQLGRREGGIYARLKDDIDWMRKVYEERVGGEICKSSNYFTEELVRILAEGDEEKMGLTVLPSERSAAQPKGRADGNRKKRGARRLPK